MGFNIKALIATSVGFVFLAFLPASLVMAQQSAVAAKTPVTFKGFVKVRSNLELYVDYVKAQPGQPTVVLVNGLTYTTKQWEKYATHLVASGFGVVRYDMRGMGQTLLKYAPILRVINYKDQVKDLKDLLVQLKISTPYNIIGLSYGGGISLAFAQTYPQDVKNLIVMAPFTEPIAQTDQWLKMQVWLARQANPLNPASDDELYDFFLRQLVYTTYPASEPILLENPYKLEGVFRMVQGIRHYRAIDEVQSLPHSALSLIIAGDDRVVPRDALMNFWRAVPTASKKSISIILNSQHKIPEEVPAFLAAYTGEILRGNKIFAAGRSFTADPSTGNVKYEGGQLQLPRER